MTFMCGRTWAAVGLAGQPGATWAAAARTAWDVIIRSSANSEGAPTSTPRVLPSSASWPLRSVLSAGRSTPASKALRSSPWATARKPAIAAEPWARSPGPQAAKRSVSAENPTAEILRSMPRTMAGRAPRGKLRQRQLLRPGSLSAYSNREADFGSARSVRQRSLSGSRGVGPKRPDERRGLRSGRGARRGRSRRLLGRGRPAPGLDQAVHAGEGRLLRGQGLSDTLVRRRRA